MPQFRIFPPVVVLHPRRCRVTDQPPPRFASVPTRGQQPARQPPALVQHVDRAGLHIAQSGPRSTDPGRSTVVGMLLYHLTSCAGRRGIEAAGFAPSDKLDGHFRERPFFSTDRQSDVQYVALGEWWVIVDVPDQVLGEVALWMNTHSVSVPLDDVNACRPFRFERHEGHRCFDCLDL
jgi:hypothetical protein